MICHLKSTKEKILFILKKDNGLSIKEMMDYFSISNVAVRRHLNDLIREGFVTERTVKQEIGRPFMMYSLTGKGHQTFPNQYEQFSMEMLQDIEELKGESAVQDILHVRKERETSELTAQLVDLDFDEKIERLCTFQDGRGYMHEFEQTASGDYIIKNYNCPIFTLATSHQVICSNEKEMYREVFPDSNVKAHSYMSEGEKYCCWTITHPKNR